jgi:hypothetical protein
MNYFNLTFQTPIHHMIGQTFDPKMESNAKDFEFKKSNKCCVDFNPKVVIKRLSTEKILKYDKHFYDKYLHKTVVPVEPIERDIQTSIESQDFMRYLNLIQTKQLETKPMEALKEEFPLRVISRLGDQVVDREVIERQNGLKIQMSGKPKAKTKRSRKARLGLRLTPKPKPMNEQILRETNRKKRFLKFISRLEMTSKLSQNLSTTLGFRPLSRQMVDKLSTESVPMPKYRENEDLLDEPLRSDNGFNGWLSRNIERKTQFWELSAKLSRKHFNYGFTRRQSLEKGLRRKTGLNWRSRLVSLDCKPFTVAITRLNQSSQPFRRLISCDQMDRQSDSQICEQKSTDEWELEFGLPEFVSHSLQTVNAVINDKHHKKPKSGYNLRQLSVVLERDDKIDSMAK